ncbi:MAG: metal-dependent hydrolase [Candidatus Altiarchaeales archaeon]|nr:metal-dependent hydrolase [Candidatus Altiarchaeota archaeon]MCG2782247.1 metal-dependent hydrolase [Candidatus Altiarchaeales archaeon]MBU4266548.1 metal-dependent hydrolase [Candidatus Altiarchaeota archaeon]MBU4341725.1 metal-dependent hydrolase [Candidatus Altiarchaeota archaeon]MBU4406002.1 metal-dependent hydrolase [Candidatus Altiarchaeota archaeon]
MPSYKVHIFGYLVMVGILLLLSDKLLNFHLSIETLIFGNIIGILYSILPDMDTPSSKMRKILGRLFLAASIICLLAFVFLRRMELIYIPLMLILFLYLLWFSRHRGLFHTPIIGILLSLPLYLIDLYYVGFAIIGFFSHLVLDNEVFR